MCSIDDYYMAHLLEAACWSGYKFLISTLVRLGWTVNHKKCVSPTQSLVFLGVGITTMYLGVPSLGVFLDAVRLARLRKQCLGRGSGERRRGAAFDAAFAGGPPHVLRYRSP
jgi:hypothetical protein